MLIEAFIAIFAFALATDAATLNQLNQPQCYDQSTDFYPYYATRTGYHFVHGNITRPEGATCKPVQLWMLIRHGTRNRKKILPVIQKMVNLRYQIIQNHKNGSGELCDKDIDTLKNWHLDSSIVEDHYGSLTQHGKDELYELAERFQNKFPELLQVDRNNVNDADFVFRATDTQRAYSSLKFFARGLFGDNKVITPETPPKNDTLLLAHLNCPAWVHGITPAQMNAERDKFTEKDIFQEVLYKVGRRLGFPDGIELYRMMWMYDMCRFEMAWYPNETSIWCKMFRKDELKLIEYREDLNIYCYCGPGRKISDKIGCHTLSDMFERFKKLESGNLQGQPKGVFYFDHTVTLQTLMTALRIGEEIEPITAETYTDPENRNFRSSYLGPFATNVAAVFYKCDDPKTPNKVAFHVAEKLLKMPGCNNGLCDWEFIKNEYREDVEKCTMGFCFRDLPDSKGSANSAGFTFETLVALVMFWSSTYLFV